MNEAQRHAVTRCGWVGGAKAVPLGGEVGSHRQDVLQALVPEPSATAAEGEESAVGGQRAGVIAPAGNRHHPARRPAPGGSAMEVRWRCDHR